MHGLWALGTGRWLEAGAWGNLGLGCCLAPSHCCREMIGSSWFLHLRLLDRSSVERRSSRGWTSAHLRAKGSPSVGADGDWSSGAWWRTETRFRTKGVEGLGFLFVFRLGVRRLSEEDVHWKCGRKPTTSGDRGRPVGATLCSGLSSRCLTAVFSILQSLLQQNASDSSWARKMTAQHPQLFHGTGWAAGRGWARDGVEGDSEVRHDWVCRTEPGKQDGARSPSVSPFL